MITAFIDIESVSITELPTDNLLIDLFSKKYEKEIELICEESGIEKLSVIESVWQQKAALHAEFGKVICASIGFITGDILKIKTITSKNEKDLLEKLGVILSKKFTRVCAHNGMEFDFPFLMRRYIINGLPVPGLLDTFGRKPWEMALEDTVKMWSGTSYNYKASLKLLAYCLGLPNPKDDIDGSMVGELYYSQFKTEKDELPFDKEEEVMKRIGAYCAKDVETLVNCYNKMRGVPIVTTVEYV